MAQEGQPPAAAFGVVLVSGAGFAPVVSGFFFSTVS